MRKAERIAKNCEKYRFKGGAAGGFSGKIPAQKLRDKKIPEFFAEKCLPKIFPERIIEMESMGREVGRRPNFTAENPEGAIMDAVHNRSSRKTIQINPQCAARMDFLRKTETID